MRPLTLILATAIASSAEAGEPPEARVVRTANPPQIDGRLDDASWRRAHEQRAFVERAPRLRQAPPVRTAFRLLYDEAALYVAVRCDDDKAAAIQARTRGRDNTALFIDDAISIKIDPAHDHRTTVGFVINPLGAWIDYRVVEEEDLRVEFDPVWQRAARRDERGWSLEARIPFTALGIDARALPGQVGFNISRYHPRRNADYDWALMAPPFSPFAASRFGHLTGLQTRQHGLPTPQHDPSGVQQSPQPAPDAKAPKAPFALIPYAIAGFRREPPESGDGGLETNPELNAGLDMLFGLGRNWRGQLSINTDFAQVDLDNQVVNLTRFGLFLPEKRDFFLRDLEVYAFGRPEESQPLYTRRIGLSDTGEEVPIVSAIKAVGRPADWLRSGVLHVLTAPKGQQPRLPRRDERPGATCK